MFSAVVQDIIGGVTAVLTVVCYIPYALDMKRGHTRPHVFSWIIWGLVNIIVFAAQLSDGAGPGAWATGFLALADLLIAAVAVKRSENKITRSDWVAFIAGLLAIPFWYFTGEALLAVIFAIIVDAFAYYPTFRKSFAKPHEETLSTYVIYSLTFFLALFALERVTWVTALFPLYMVAINLLFVFMVLWRRRVGRQSGGK